MAPKRAAEDDFIYTLSDNEDIPIDGEEVSSKPPKKKAKKAKTSKKDKKAQPVEYESEEEEDDDKEKPQGIWGANDDDDGAMNPDFEFAMDDGGGAFAEMDFEGWGFDGAKKGLGARKNVDVDEIIRRRQEKKNKNGKKPVVNGEGEGEDEAADEDELEVAAEVDLDDDDDEVLADDAFGMGAASDEEDGENGGSEGSEADDNDDDEPASDNDSVATPTGHPDDHQSDASDDEDEVDEEEQAKAAAFFAPAEKEKPGKKKNPSPDFLSMSLSRPILRGINKLGFTKPTPIQTKSIPVALMGLDIVGGAVTGSGKTGAFMIPILERLFYRPNKTSATRVVVLTPTRELAMQCHAVTTMMASFTDIQTTLAVGGLSLKAQAHDLRLRPDIIIATPGRFIDHMRNTEGLAIDLVEILVLDEADRMLEDGFANELNEIMNTLPKQRQTMLFSATMTSSVDELIRLGMKRPLRLMVDSEKKTVGTLTQNFVRIRPGREDKRMGYLAYLCQKAYREKVIVFFREKKDIHRARITLRLLGLACGELHGSMPQEARISNIEAFRDGKVTHLLATDVASRGLDIKGVATVINYEVPQNHSIYVHRVGRTARAGRKGTSVTLATENDRKIVKAAVKAGKAQGSKVASLTIDAKDADKWQEKIDGMGKEIEAVIKEEKQERALANAEMQLKKGENMIKHEAEIKARPRRTWFETQDDKRKAKQVSAAELNGTIEKTRAAMKTKDSGRLSNKDKKKLDVMTMRKEGGTWKGGKSRKGAAGGGGGGAGASAGRKGGKKGSGARGWKKK